MNNDVFTYFLEEANEHFSGWDFSYLSSTGRVQEFPLSWNYRNIVKIHMLNAKSLLDMGTGGGEFLSKLMPLPAFTCATEGYAPNYSIAKNRLEPLGIKVYKVDNDNSLPFSDEMFDLIINRHESYSPNEVKRILKENGTFITQQVGGLNDKEINELLDAPKSSFEHWDLQFAVRELKDAGFTIIDQKEDLVKTRFYDIGAIVYYLKAIPWQVHNFTVAKYHEKLRKIHRMIEKESFIDFTCHRFLIIAKK